MVIAVPALPIPPIWGALPPEVNTARLMAGAGAGPMMQAAAGWEAFAISLEAQADELAASLASLAVLWQGIGSERAIEASTPMVAWLRTLSFQAHKRAIQAAAQASAYSTALAATPQLPEIESNHVTNAVLNATNFLGVNTIPIAVNEADYLRMWDQAVTVMTAYEAETVFNTTFEPIVGPTPIVVPGATGMAMATGMASATPLVGSSAVRDAVFTHVSGQGKADETSLKTGRVNQLATEAANRGRPQSEQANALRQDLSPGMQMGAQMASQLGSTLGQLPQQMMQGVAQPFQQLTQPLQQVSAMFGQMSGLGSADKGAQVGLIGAAPFSNHPAIGGNGRATGSGMVRATSLPGAGGTTARTPLMSTLIGNAVQPSLFPLSADATGATAAASGGPIPTGVGPIGSPGQRGQGEGNKTGLNAPALLSHDLDADDEDDW